MSNKEILFGICTYNREDVLLKSIDSLKNIRDLDSVDIVIFDDCSTDYDENRLKEIIPFAKRIIRQSKNVGADKNTSDMYEYFIKSEYSWLFNADSDLIYSLDIVKKINYYKDRCNGFMTFFNCINHNDIGENADFVIKDEVGAAGCLLNKQVVELILNNIKHRSFGFDVSFSKLLKKSGFSLFCTKQSYVQHIGVNGYNSRNIRFDYGKNFLCDNAINGSIIEDTFEQYMTTVGSFRSTKAFRLFNFIISFPRRIAKVFKMLY